MGSKWYRIIVAVFLVISISMLTQDRAFAGADDLAKKADKIIRNAERKMHSGKNEEASIMLLEAALLLEQGKGEEPTNSRVLRTEKKLDRIQKMVDKKLAKTSGTKSSSSAKLPKKPQVKAMTSKSSGANMADKKTSSTKLPGGVKKRLKDITRHLDKAERYANSDSKNAEAKLESAGELFEEIDSVYSSQFDPTHPDYIVVKNRYNALAGKAVAQGVAEVKAEADAAEAKAAKEKQSAEWVAKFQEYLAHTSSEGHNPAKIVFVPGTSEPEKFADAQRRYEEFKKFFEEYKKTDFPNGKTYKLENLADNVAPNRLKGFEEGFASRMGSVVGRAESEISAAMSYLNKDNGWQSDKSIRPHLLDHKRMTSIKNETEGAISALGVNSNQAKQIQGKFDSLVSKDKENRQIRKERTFMISDRYKGKDIEDLRKKAKSLVKNNREEGGTPMRCTVIDENWREERVQEWTDTSRTVSRWRTTRHETAQVAAKTSSGVRLITVALAQDKQSNGRWGDLYGNLHQGYDPMLESNVNKKGP